MNTPNPLVPQGTPLEQKSRARSRVKLAVFFVLTIHVVGLVALLVQGCRPEPPETSGQPELPPELPVFEPVPVPPVDTNPVLQAPVDLPPPGGAVQSPRLELPPETPVAMTPDTGSAVQEYVIKRGDTYYSIGRQFGVTMQAIKDANPGVDPTRLQVGQKILVPPPAASPAPAMAPSASGEIIYTVVSGDTLSRIAAKHGTTWQAIQQLNNLPTTSIKVGQKLRIPAPAPTAGGGM